MLAQAILLAGNNRSRGPIQVQCTTLAVRLPCYLLNLPTQGWCRLPLQLLLPLPLLLLSS
jgi:hypothetical protein